MVTLNDEMPQTNATVVAQLHHFLLAGEQGSLPAPALSPHAPWGPRRAPRQGLCPGPTDLPA